MFNTPEAKTYEPLLLQEQHYSNVACLGKLAGRLALSLIGLT